MKIMNSASRCATALGLVALALSMPTMAACKDAKGKVIVCKATLTSTPAVAAKPAVQVKAPVVKAAVQPVAKAPVIKPTVVAVKPKAAPLIAVKPTTGSGIVASGGGNIISTNGGGLAKKSGN